VKDDPTLSTILDALKILVWTVCTVGPFVSDKTKYWTRQKSLNLIFGVLLIGTNLLMTYFSLPAEVQLYSASGTVWLPFTLPSSLPNVPHNYIHNVGILVDIFTGFLILAGIGITIGITRLNKFCNIPDAQPPRTIGGAGIL
jgi:hypothetical protein